MNADDRAQATLAAYEAAGPGPYRIDTPDGTVVIDHVTVSHDNDADVDVVEVHASEFEDPHFRVVNPPRFVPDPNGDVLINGQPFSEDPLVALAHLIVQHAGPAKDPRRGVA